MSDKSKQNQIIPKSKKFTADEMQFAADTKSALLNYVDSVRSGYHDGESPKPKITYGEINANTEYWRQRNAGIKKPKVKIIDHKSQQPWTYRSGPKQGQPVYFNPFHNYKVKVWHDNYGENLPQLESIANCIKGYDRDYFTAPAAYGKKLENIDADIHEPWQDDLETKAIPALKEIFEEHPFWRYSFRGYNGWVKFGNAPAGKKYSDAMQKAQKQLQDIFAAKKIKTDIELKGHNGLAKLPTWNHRFPCYRKDNKDVWNRERLNEFIEKPDMDFQSFIDHIAEIHSHYTPEQIAEGYAWKKQVEEDWKQAQQPEVERQPLTASETPVIVLPDDNDTQCNETQLPVSLRSTKSPATQVDFSFGCYASDSSILDEIRSTADAFEKDRNFALWANRKAKRTLSADELLELDHQYHIYSGEWSDGLAARKQRYADIAPFVANGFDASKCGNKSQRPILEANIKEWKSKAHLFPKIAIGYCGSEENKKALKVKRDTMIYLAAIIQTVSKENKDCPRDSIESWWRELAEANLLPAWSSDHYIAARSILIRYKLICVNHDCYFWSPDHRGQSKKIWIREQKKVGESNYSYPADDMVDCLSSFIFIHTNKYNRYNLMVIENQRESALLTQDRPPPD